MSMLPAFRVQASWPGGQVVYWAPFQSDVLVVVGHGHLFGEAAHR